MIDLTAEQRHLAKRVHDYACRFPLTEEGDAQLLQSCYDYRGMKSNRTKTYVKVLLGFICFRITIHRT